MRRAAVLLLLAHAAGAFVPGADGPVTSQVQLEGQNATLLCDASTAAPGDALMLLVWYKDNAPVYSFDARVSSEWWSESFNDSARVTIDRAAEPTVLSISSLRDDDQALYHCRVDFLLSPTRNCGVDLTVVVLPSQPFFLDEFGNKVENSTGPYHEGDTLVLSCLVIGGRPPPHISWYSGATLVDDTSDDSDIPGVRENQLYLPLSRDRAGPLACRATNCDLVAPAVAEVHVELYLPASSVTIEWSAPAPPAPLRAGAPAVARCRAAGARPAPELAWWLGHTLLTEHTQSWSNATGVAESLLHWTPQERDHGATLSCIATNVAMAPSRGSAADVIVLNVTYSPIVEVTKIGSGRMSEIIELDPLHLECEIRANPPPDKIEWYFNDMKIPADDKWGNTTGAATLRVAECSRQLAGRYSCAAGNGLGETRSHHLAVTVLYPPQCTPRGITLKDETLSCNVDSLPGPDTFFWHIHPRGPEPQHLTSGAATLPLDQVSGPLDGVVQVSCEAGNGVASQETPCEATLRLDHLRPPQPTLCDLAFEAGVFQVRCAPVARATYYEVSVWRLSAHNTSLAQARGARAAARGGGARAALPPLRAGDEAAAAACNRYGCSRALVLRPTDTLLRAAAPPWWTALVEKDVVLAAGAAVLVCVFIISTWLALRLARLARPARPHPAYLDELELKRNVGVTCSLRSFASTCSVPDDPPEPPPQPPSQDPLQPPPVERMRKPLYYWEPPPPDVTLTLHRESAV